MSAGQGSHGSAKVIRRNGSGDIIVKSGGEIEVESGGFVDIESGGELRLAGTQITATAAEVNQLDASVATIGAPKIAGVSFTEDGSGTSYTGAVALPAGSLLLDIYVFSTVLWDGTSASAIVGDDTDPNGFFDAVNLKATNLLVGEILQMSNSEYWGGLEGAYLTAATGTRTAYYYAAADNITMVVTPGAADGSAGRSFMYVHYATPVLVASTNV